MTFAEQISIISFAVILVFCMAAYLRSHSRYENGIFHKAGCLLSYGYLKICLAAGYAKRAFMMKLEGICSSYHFQDASEEFRHKENRLRELQMEISRSGYARHAHNLKILD